MIIRGRFIVDAPYISAHLRVGDCHEPVRLLADTGASRTTILDRDTNLLGIRIPDSEPASLPIVGIGGSVRSFVAPGAEIALASDEARFTLKHEVFIVQHDLAQLPPDGVARILRLASIMGRDILNRFCFTCDYPSGIVQLEQE